MENKALNTWFIISSLIVGIMIGLYLRGLTDNPITKYVDNIIYKDNVIEKIVPKEVIKFRTKGKIEYIDRVDSIEVHDTIYKVKPFVARLDTIVNDTINIDYAYPDNQFYVYVRPKIDTIKVTIPNQIKEVEKTNWTYTTISGIGGLLIGIFAR